MFVLSQMIPFPGKLYYDGEVVKEEVRIAYYKFESKMKDIAVEIARTYYELGYLAQAIDGGMSREMSLQKKGLILLKRID